MEGIRSFAGRMKFGMWARTGCIAVFIFMWSYSADGQIPNLSDKARWVHFSSSAGLPPSEITGIYESRDSTLWVATLAGIAWFDGFRWRRSDGNSALPTSGAYMFEGEYRDSVLAFCDGVYYLGNRYGFRPFLLRDRDSLTFAGDSSRRTTRGVFFSLFRNTLAVGDMVPFVRKITGYYPTKWGSLWVTLPDGMYHEEGNRWKNRLPRSGDQVALGAISVSENKQGSGLCLIRSPAEQMGMWEWTDSGPVHRSILDTSFHYIVSADLDEEGNAVAVSQSGQVFVRYKGRWSDFPFFPEAIKNITSVLYRRNGDLCIGCDDGIYIWRHSFSRWTLFPQSRVEFANDINELLMTKKGDLWIGSADGVDIRHPNGQSEEITMILGRRITNVTGLAEDEQGNVWISSGASFDGAYRWDGKVWMQYAVGPLSRRVFIHKIRKDHSGHLWFLGLWSETGLTDDTTAGAYLFDHETFTRWGVNEGLISSRVYAFDEGQDGTYWFDTHRGISRYTSGKWTHWTAANGLRQNHVFCLAVDHEGGVWFGHMTTSGLGHIDQRDSVQYFGVEDGIPDNRIYDIRVDSTGVVWIASRGGLCCYDHGTWSTYDDASGLVSNAIWPVLPLKSKVCVGTTGNGIAILNRDAGVDKYPVVVIDTPIVDNQSVFVRWRSYAHYGEVTPDNALTRYRIGNDKWYPWNTTHEVSLWQLRPGTYSISVEGKGLYGQFNTEPAHAYFTILPPVYLRPVIYLPGSAAVASVIVLLLMMHFRRVRHRKEIERSEERYHLITDLMSDYAYLCKIEAGGNRTVQWITGSFTRLTGYSPDKFKEPGFIAAFYYPDDQPVILKMYENVVHGNADSCETRVRTGNGRELWVHNYAVPIWNKEHTHVTHLYGIAADITRRKHDEDQMRKLAAELALTEQRERRRMATFLHDSVSQTLAFAKIKLRSVERMPLAAPASGSLAEVRQLIEESLDNTRSLTFELSPPALSELGLSEALRSLAEKLFEEHQIKLEFAGDQIPNRLPNEAGVVLYYSVRETFVNIIKHARASAVSVSVCFDKDSICVTVHDDGVGITTDGEGGSDSFGLFSIRERLAHLGGSLEVRSNPEGGTTVMLKVPMDAAFYTGETV